MGPAAGHVAGSAATIALVAPTSDDAQMRDLIQFDLGQATMSAEEAQKVVGVLGLGPDVAAALQVYPMKGSLDADVPVDPLIYRFHEITQVYGTTLKALIQEMFGDGIMSAIDFTMDVAKQEDPKGDRVVVTMNGKFLPYKKW